MKKIFTSNQEDFSAFLKLCVIFSKGIDKLGVLQIKDKVLKHKTNSGYLSAEVSNFEPESTFQILNPQESIKTLKMIQGDNIEIIESDTEKKFYVITPKMSFRLPMYYQNLDISEPKTDFITLSSIKIDSDVASTISGTQKDYGLFYVLLGVDANNTIQQIHIKDSDVVINLNPGTEPGAMTFFKVFEVFNSDVVKASKDDVLLELLYSEEYESHFIRSTYKIGKYVVTYLEKISTKNEFDMFSLN